MAKVEYVYVKVKYNGWPGVEMAKVE